MAAIAPAIQLLAAAALAPDQPMASDPGCSPDVACVADAAAAQSFELAERLAAAGDTPQAERILRQLARHPSLQLRSEARFRLAMLVARGGRLAAAAVLLRQILSDDPAASRVRLELAQVLDRLGDESAARRALREIQAGGLPPEVALLVDRYSAALRARKPTGATIEVSIAPDSNINRATSSSSLGTVFGDLTLDRDARETSGIGLAMRGQAYARTKLSTTANLVGKVSTSLDLYRKTQFNDVAIGISAGPELALGPARLAPELGAIWRWHGTKPFLRTAYFGVGFLRPLGRRSQVRATAAAGSIDNRLNDEQDGRSYAFSLSIERAFSARAGGGFTLLAERQDLRARPYSTTSGQLSVFGYRELGSATVSASLSYLRLEADERLFLYPKIRKEGLYRATIGATFRKLAVAGFAPLVRITVEQNRSSLAIFDYRRVRTEIGIARAY